MDTATETLAVGVATEKGQLLASSTTRIPRSHSRLLQPAIAETMWRAGLVMADLTSIGVGVGPGSYTGVRIGVSTAKAMCDALSLPLITVPTLHALAAAALPSVPTRDVQLVASFLFARRGRAYGALYTRNSQGWRCLKRPVVQSMELWRDVLAEMGSSRSSAFGWFVVHDFADEQDFWLMLQDVPISGAVRSSRVSAQLPASLAQLAASGAYPTRRDDAVYHVVPDYALEVQAVTLLQERSGERS